MMQSVEANGIFQADVPGKRRNWKRKERVNERKHEKIKKNG